MSCGKLACMGIMMALKPSGEATSEVLVQVSNSLDSTANLIFTRPRFRKTPQGPPLSRVIISSRH